MDYNQIKANLKTVYNQLAKFWEAETSDWGRSELKEFASLIKRNGGRRVLDLGCGSGIQSKQLYDGGLSVVGLDLSPKMVDRARKRVPEAKFVVGDIAKLSFPKNSFDGIYARAALLHIPKNLIPKVLELVHKILKVNGVFYLTVKEGTGEMEVKSIEKGQKVKRFFSFFKVKELRRLLESSNFQVLKISRIKTSTPTYWLEVFVKKI